MQSSCKIRKTDFMDNRGNKPPHIMRILFGILMVFIYLGMGGLMLINFFNWSEPALYYPIGGLLVVYGIYRGYRQYKGLDYN